MKKKKSHLIDVHFYPGGRAADYFNETVFQLLSPVMDSILHKIYPTADSVRCSASPNNWSWNTPPLQITITIPQELDSEEAREKILTEINEAFYGLKSGLLIYLERVTEVEIIVQTAAISSGTFLWSTKKYKEVAARKKATSNRKSEMTEE